LDGSLSFPYFCSPSPIFFIEKINEMTTVNLRVKEITALIKKLSDEDQEALLKALKSQILLKQARLLDNSVEKNDFSVEAILKVVRQVRQAHPYANQQNRS